MHNSRTFSIPEVTRPTQVVGFAPGPPPPPPLPPGPPPPLFLPPPPPPPPEASLNLPKPGLSPRCSPPPRISPWINHPQFTSPWNNYPPVVPNYEQGPSVWRYPPAQLTSTSDRFQVMRGETECRQRDVTRRRRMRGSPPRTRSTPGARPSPSYQSVAAEIERSIERTAQRYGETPQQQISASTPPPRPVKKPYKPPQKIGTNSKPRFHEGWRKYLLNPGHSNTAKIPAPAPAPIKPARKPVLGKKKIGSAQEETTQGYRKIRGPQKFRISLCFGRCCKRPEFSGAIHFYSYNERCLDTKYCGSRD